MKENDMPRLYHVPRNPQYNPETAVVEQIVLSVTQTAGVYSLIGYPCLDAKKPDVPTSLPQSRPPRTVCFLHRPFTLDRRKVRRGTLVLSSHTSFDGVLTVGWNGVLAERLGINVDESVCIQGYKGDSERKIGIVGQVSVYRDTLSSHIQGEFLGTELLHEGVSSEIRVIAIMNAFHENEVLRALEIAQQRDWIAQDTCTPGQHLLYLTGQPRLGGLEAAKALGMTVVCVGHRQAEEWDIRYMAAQLRAAYLAVKVEEVYEEEVFVPRDMNNRIPVDKIWFRFPSILYSVSLLTLLP